MESFQKRSLTDWVLSQSDGADPTLQNIKVSSFPTTVHVELLKIGKIPDPVGRCRVSAYLLTNWSDNTVYWVA